MELLSIAATAAYSADFVVGSTPVTLIMKNTSGVLLEPSAVKIEIKAGSNYYKVGELTDKDSVKVLSGAGTYRVSRGVVAYAIGVEKEG